MQRNLLRFIAALSGLAFPTLAYAMFNVDVSQIDPCVVSGLACIPDLSLLFNQTVIQAAKTAFRGVLLGSIFYYGIRLLFGAESENMTTETRQAFEYAVMAGIILVLAEVLANAFATPGAEIAVGEVGSKFGEIVIPFIEGLVAAALVANITVQGFRMIVASDEAGTTKARKRFLHGIIGVAIALLASPIVNTFWGKEISTGTEEIVGIGDFLITIFGALAVVGIIVGGIMLVVSIDESFKDKARKLLLACLVALIVVISAGALLHLFLLPQR